jgi:hypothetical protein
MVRRKVMVASMAVVAFGALAACGSTPSAQPPQTVSVPAPPNSTSTNSGSTSNTPSSGTGSGGGAASNAPASGPERPDSVKSDATPRCSAATLTGDIESSDAAAGNRYAKLAVTNTGKAACTLYGYGGLQLADVAGKGMPTKLTRKADPGPTLVTLQPGQKGFKNLHWGAVADGTEPTDGPCEPPSTGAIVIPPDETQPFTVKYDFGAVCEEGSIEGSAYYK